MNERINALLEKMQKLEEELEAEITKAGERLSYTIQERKVRFEESARAYHLTMRKSLYRFIREASVWSVLSAPVIYSLLIPMLFLDMCVSLYQAICFPIYGIKKVPRSDFIILDRPSLDYLNAIEKVNCAYCGYANGLAAWFREVAARTEEHWCPIKHAEKIKNPHSRYRNFVEYGDAEGYRKRVEDIDKRKG